MDIQEFIEESLFQIANAIKQVNQRFDCDQIPAQANPAGANLTAPDNSTMYKQISDTHSVEFDIAVTVTESLETSSSKKGGMKISILSGSLDGSKASESTNSSVSRLKFTIPLKLPRPTLAK